MRPAPRESRMHFHHLAFAAALAWVGLAAPVLAQPAARHVGSDGIATLRCGGLEATVVGSGNRLDFAGPCRGLVVSGSNNTIDIELAPRGTVRIDGDNNRVLYAGPVAPVAVTRGASNQVLPSQTARAAPGTLVLDASSPASSAQCGGLDVLIRGNGRRYVLLGGCRSVTVQGSLTTITAELLPGAAVSIGGAAVTMNYVLVGEGPAPVVRVTAPGLKASQIQHFGETQLSLPTYR